MKKYGPEDFDVLKDSFEVIRRKPEMYAGEKPWGPNLAVGLVKDLVHLNVMPATVEKIDGWWVVSSAKDWLLQADCGISLEVFSNITRNLAIGRYAIREETVIAALADAVVTVGSGGLATWIAGDENHWPLPAGLTKKISNISPGRLVAFRFDEP